MFHYQKLLNLFAAALLLASMLFIAMPASRTSAATESNPNSTTPIELEPGESVEIVIKTGVQGIPQIKYVVSYDGSSIRTTRYDCVGGAKSCSWQRDDYYPRAINYCRPWAYWGNELCLNVHLNPSIRAYKPTGSKTLLVSYPAGAEITYR